MRVSRGGRYRRVPAVTAVREIPDKKGPLPLETMKPDTPEREMSGLLTEIYFINSSVNRMISGASLSRCLFVTRI